MGVKERRTREKENRRSQILDASRTLLFKKGIHSVTIQQIAKLAELSVGTIYFYYKSKEEIFAALQEEGLEILHEAVRAAAARPGAASEKIEAIAEAYFEFSESHRDYYHIINYFLSAPQVIFPDHLKDRIDRQGNRTLSLITTIIEEGGRSGEFAGVDPRRCAVVLWGLLYGIIQFWKLRGTSLKDDDQREIYRYGVARLVAGMKKGALKR